MIDDVKSCLSAAVVDLSTEKTMVYHQRDSWPRVILNGRGAFFFAALGAVVNCFRHISIEIVSNWLALSLN